MGTDEKRGEQDVCLEHCRMNAGRGEATTGATELEWWLYNNGNVGLLVLGPETAQLMASSMRAGIESALGMTPSAVPGV